MQDNLNSHSRYQIMIYSKENIFHKIINRKMESDIVYEDDAVLAFHDKFKKSNIHILVVPKGEFVSYDDFIEKSSDQDIVYFFRKVREISHLVGAKDSYRLMTNHGAQMGQMVFHFHVHIMGGGFLNK